MSAQLSIQSAIVAALNSAPALSNVRANSMRPMSASQSQSIVVRLIQSRAATPQVLSGSYEWVTDYQVECLARAANASTDPASVVDSLLDAAWARLASMSPSGVGVIDVRMLPEIQWQYDDADTPMAAAIISMQVLHRTAATSLTAWT